MGHPQVVAFARLANGNGKPIRQIAGQNTLITRNIHDMAYNPIRDEIVIPQTYLGAVMTYRADANGDAAPIRTIHGPDTQITFPYRVALDPVHEEIYVPLNDQILVFPSLADGNVAPVRILKGPDTQLGASAMAVDPVHNLLVVMGPTPRVGAPGGPQTTPTAGAPGGPATMPTAGGPGGTVTFGSQILTFNRTDSGNVKPRTIIKGPQAKVANTWLLRVYPPKELILAAIAGPDRNSERSFLGIWKESDNGDVPASYVIGGPNGILRAPRGVALDVPNKNVIVSDKFLNAVFTFNAPEIF